MRLDLDSMLSKIDPYLIQTATVIPGPYGVQYGPGFSFINVQTIDTPRSTNGCTQWNNRFSILARGNGSSLHCGFEVFAQHWLPHADDVVGIYLFDFSADVFRGQVSFS